MISQNILKEIERVSKLIDRNPDKYSKLALFDMDNTLLIGDIGEATYAKLRAENHHVHIGWSEYKEALKKEGPSIAYRKILKAKRGLKKDTIYEVTKMVISDGGDIKFEEDEKIITKASPSPNPIMQELVKHLNILNYKVFVITASSKYIADAIIDSWFDIKIENVYGVQHEIEEINEELILKGSLIEPAPILEGKAAVYLNHIEKKPPLIAAGDSLNDVPMFNLVPKEGLIIIAKRSDEYTQKILDKMETQAKVIVV